MEWLLVVLAVVIIAAIVKKKGDEGSDVVVPVDPLVVVVPVEESLPPTGRWITINDMQPNLDTIERGDPDSYPDLVAQLAMAVWHKELPMAIGVTSMEGGLGIEATKEIVDLSGLKIPVLAGHRSLRAHLDNQESELSKFIVRESKKGMLHIICGGPVTDIAMALRKGANAGNITVYLTRGTTNERIGEGATAEVVGKVSKTIETPKNHLWHALGKKGQTKLFSGQDPIQWINALRTNKAWDRANNPQVIRSTRAMNTFMNEFQTHHPSRMADFMHLVDYFGISASAYDHQFNVIKAGMKQMEKYQK